MTFSLFFHYKTVFIYEIFLYDETEKGKKPFRLDHS